jgi:hypothetical protein
MVKGKEKIKPAEDALAVEEVGKPKKLTWRYHCDACSGRATYASEPYVFTSVICENCGASCEYNEGNWIKVTDKEEMSRINAPELQSEI